MADVPTPVAARLQKPSWKDARLLVGVLLVLAATVLGSLVVASADDRTPMYAASGPLLPGERLTAERLKRVDVQLGDEARGYLPASSGVPADSYVLREVQAGELVPQSAMGSKSEVGVQPLTLMVDANSAAPLVVGSIVDVYVNPAGKAAAGGQEFTGPELTLESVSVSALPSSGSRLGGSSAQQAVQVMAPRERVRDLIGQVDLGARVTLVPVAGSPLKADS